jgi:hypothetical protein
MANDFETENGSTREELVERVALMEAMIAEGRQTTGQVGWIFVMWGVLYFVATGWVYFLRARNWAWPVCIMAGVVVLAVWGQRQRRREAVQGPRSRTIRAVWTMTGIGLGLFSTFGGISHRAEHGIALYLAGILFFIGVAHGTSAAILRWAAQGVVAAIWWGGGIAMLFASSEAMRVGIFLGATFFGQIVFGLYAMWLERRRTASAGVLRHG